MRSRGGVNCRVIAGASEASDSNSYSILETRNSKLESTFDREAAASQTLEEELEAAKRDVEKFQREFMQAESSAEQQRSKSMLDISFADIECGCAFGGSGNSIFGTHCFGAEQDPDCDADIVNPLSKVEPASPIQASML